jgi:type IV fimbrial biogenesis protein FimT
VELAGADRPLQVQIKLGGQVRMCDPARTLSATQPDGCPAP